MTTQNAIAWPERYRPGTGDNFVSSEVVVAGLSAADVWRHLVDTSRWESYYDNVADISFPRGGGPVLTDGIHFGFGTRAVCPGRRSRTVESPARSGRRGTGTPSSPRRGQSPAFSFGVTACRPPPPAPSPCAAVRPR
ncbi:hypothetical protein ACWCQW_09780 [Streptomyces mirabilis]